MSKKQTDRLTRLRQRIRDDALKEGFGDIAFTSAEAVPHLADRLDAFIRDGHHGSMTWIKETRDRRIAPTAMWGAAKTAIVMVMNYGPDHDPMDNLSAKDAGNISVYARGRDYHDVIKGRLKQIAGRIAAREGVMVKVFVDTAPLMEKPLAAQSGLGWQGKHTNLVSREYGSWLFLGVILTDAYWAEDATSDDHCGSCTRCLDICPTKAFPEPYRLDASRCISYLTIEHDGMIPVEFRKPMGNRIFGCDDCLAVCPWNSFAQQGHEAKLQSMAGLDLPPLSELLALDEARFKSKFSGTPVRRAGYVNFTRNVLIAIGNSGEASHQPALKEQLSSPHDVIKATAIWALKQLMDEDDFAVLKDKHLSPEDSDHILAEWNSSINPHP